MRKFKKSKSILLATTIILGLSQKGWSADGHNNNRIVEYPSVSSRALREALQERMSHFLVERNDGYVPQVVTQRTQTVEGGRTFALDVAGGSVANLVAGALGIAYQSEPNVTTTDTTFMTLIPTNNVLDESRYQALGTHKTTHYIDDERKPKPPGKPSSSVSPNTETSALLLADSNHIDLDLQEAIQRSIDSSNRKKEIDLQQTLKQSRESLRMREARDMQQAHINSMHTSQSRRILQEKSDAEIAEEEQIKETLRVSTIMK